MKIHFLKNGVWHHFAQGETNDLNDFVINEFV